MRGAIAVIVISLGCFGFSTYQWQRDVAFADRGLTTTGQVSSGRSATVTYTDQFGSQHSFPVTESRFNRGGAAEVEYLRDDTSNARLVNGSRLPTGLLFVGSGFVMAFGFLCLYATIWDKRRNAQPLDVFPATSDQPETFTSFEDSADFVSFPGTTERR